MLFRSPPPSGLFQVDPGVGEALRARLEELRRRRDGDRARRALDRIEATARGRDNLLPPILEAVNASVTLGEICDVLRRVFGVHQPSVVF